MRLVSSYGVPILAQWLGLSRMHFATRAEKENTRRTWCRPSPIACFSMRAELTCRSPESSEIDQAAETAGRESALGLWLWSSLRSLPAER